MWRTVSARLRGKKMPIYNENYNLYKGLLYVA